MALQFVALGLGLLGSIIAYFATVNDDWAHSDVSGQVIESQKTTIGLWKQCLQVSTGLDSCDSYDNLLLGADAAEIVARFFCCFAVLFGFVSVALFLMGMTCSHLGQSAGSKKKLRCTAGILMVIGGLLILVSGGFMGYDVKQHYDHFTMRNFNGYNGMGNNFRGRREAPDMTAVNDYLDGCQSPWVKCDVEFCQGDAECEAAFDAATNGSKKGTRQFRTTQALVFGIGIFMAWIAGVIQIASGAIMMTQGCGGGDDEEDYQSDYGYNQGNNIVNNQYGGTQRSDNSRKQFV